MFMLTSSASYWLLIFKGCKAWKVVYYLALLATAYFIEIFWGGGGVGGVCGKEERRQQTNKPQPSAETLNLHTFQTYQKGGNF